MAASFPASYYSPDSILTDAQKVPCTMNLALPTTHLPALNHGAAVTAGLKLDLPLWLAEMLAVTKPGQGRGGMVDDEAASLASIDMPTALGHRVLNALRAEPRSVDIRAQAGWFYGLGERMLELFEEEELIEVLEDSFKIRAFEIADKAQNTRAVQHGADGNEFTNGLDETERRLFRAAHDGTSSVKRWFEHTSKS
ncbi:GINS complex, Psf3 component [Dissoconium aciculare CBS 342.82]|uniref:DNA replication complex GINS protein PSF3 n=1 Tax=Dissoconium aciculare CBS 342.82 TaxID=1314786 RepID=A0A6J3M245_9PEZI|nr:GINS complex, Psf3 component [Dissoconium aciculare CBS 342.82]KAF1821983.1 GINS complex, Psf3 component [Dissoconium aciculare CBS 342.82]